MKDWHDISYLRKGTPIQREVYDVITSINVMGFLAGFSPVLAGTFPIGINIPGSDLDIICSFNDQSRFLNVIRENFQYESDFSLNTKNIRGQESVIARYRYKDYKIEIFGQSLRVEDQYAYRHMIIESKLLEERGEAFRKKVLDLKIKGHSTEEAFAIVLGIKRDPYEGLLTFEG